MPDESESVDNDEAGNILSREWNRILNDDEHDYLNEEAIARKIGEVLNGSQLTYKYIPVTNVLVKAVNPRIHYRAMQAQSDLSGAYNARSLAIKCSWNGRKTTANALVGRTSHF